MVIFILLLPVISSFILLFLKNAKAVAYISTILTIITSFYASFFIFKAFQSPVKELSGLYIDSFSAYVMSIVLFLSSAASIYSIEYLLHEYEKGLADIVYIKRFYVLFQLFVASMLLVTLTDNLALMWMAIEATTIISAPLIGLGFTKRELAIEAAWKYIILCTVGITFALFGTFICYYASTFATDNGTLSWTVLKGVAKDLNPNTMKLTFIFVLVGFGTKAGLAPLHSWLPDAHSQAPTPISAVLSGILLNTAFYGIIRYIMIVQPSTGIEFTSKLLLIFGGFSIVVSGIFIPLQNNYKRLLAYSSIEHMGIISIGFGAGGAGVYAGLLHILNHAIAKPLMFFVSGKVQSHYGSLEIEKVDGVLKKLPSLGIMCFIGVLALTGTPPFNVFLSEILVFKSLVDKGLWGYFVVTLLFIILIFFGMINKFSGMLFCKACEEVNVKKDRDYKGLFIMILFSVLSLILGLKIPKFIDFAIKSVTVLIGS